MINMHWALEGTDASIVKIGGHTFAASETGAPMLCNMVCQEQYNTTQVECGHVHIDYCRAATASECSGNEIEHLSARISPHVDRPKDAVSHAVFWKRTGV